MNYYKMKKLQENFLYELPKLDRQFDMVGINTFSKESIRVRNKNKGKWKKNNKVDSRNSADESSYERIDPSIINSTESFLSEYSDTLNDDLIGLSKQCLTYSKNLIIGHLNINSMRNKFSSLQQTVLSKTDILLLSETKIVDSFPGSQFFAEGFKMYHEDRTKTRGGILLYLVISSILTNSRKILEEKVATIR